MSTKIHKPYAKYLFHLIPSRGDSDLLIKRIMALSVVLCPKFHFKNRVKFQDGVRNRGQNGGKKEKRFFKTIIGLSYYNKLNPVGKAKKK